MNVVLLGINLLNIQKYLAFFMLKFKVSFNNTCNATK